jgi:hypothetical protein
MSPQTLQTRVEKLEGREKGGDPPVLLVYIGEGVSDEEKERRVAEAEAEAAETGAIILYYSGNVNPHLL